MRWLLLALLGLLALFQYQLWFGEGGLRQKTVLEEQVSLQLEENRKLEMRNQELTDTVDGLKDGLDGIEERARQDLGMIREGETFYMVIEPEKQP
jgi:cell division protein FtsB